MNTQAERIIKKFGGARRLAEALKAIERPYHHTTIYKWTYPKEVKGTGGIIPTAALPDVVMAARAAGILLSSEDLDPRPNPVPRTTVPKQMKFK